jgi:hypothetical protein
MRYHAVPVAAVGTAAAAAGRFRKSVLHVRPSKLSSTTAWPWIAAPVTGAVTVVSPSTKESFGPAVGRRKEWNTRLPRDQRSELLR